MASKKAKQVKKAPRVPASGSTPAPLSALKTEEDVKIKFLLPYLEQRGYAQDCIDFNVAVEVQEGRKKKSIFADVVVYATPKRTAPILLVETKAPNEILNREVRDQAISYARLLPRIAPLVAITNGAQVQVFHTLNRVRIAELPARQDLEQDILRFVIDPDLQDALRREAKHELFIIDDVRTFKNILKSCHNEIRNNEGLDPTAAFDEMSKVMFCKLYEEKENPKNNRFRTSVFDDTLERLKVNIVHKILEDAKAEPQYSGLFVDETRINLKDRTVRKIVGLLEDYDLGLTAFDVKGEAFEYFLGDTFTGGLGEFFTPRSIVEFMVDAMDPKIGDRIIDPFCGTGGLLIFAFETVSEKIRMQEFSNEEKQRWRLELSNRCLFGTDWKERTSQACKMNMMVHGDGSSGIYKRDGFIDLPGKITEKTFDLCLTNPPFGSNETDQAVLGLYELGAGRNSVDRCVLALERAIRLVKPGAYVAIVIIDGVLNNRKLKHVRDYMKAHASLQAVISLAEATFKGYGAGAKTSILLLRRKQKPDDGKQGSVFMAVTTNTGLAPNGDQIPGNQLPDILLDLKRFQKGAMKDVGKHSESWVCDDLQDRIDAEYYRPAKKAATGNVVDLRSQVGTLLTAMKQHHDALQTLEQVLGAMETEPKTLGDLFEEVEDRETLDPKVTYRLLGVRWWGNGVFVREEKPGSEIKAKALYKVKAGCLIYNRLFAFRGSFAIVPRSLAGDYVSNEFPTFVVKKGVPNAELLTRYVVHAMNSPQLLNVVERQSTGSTKQSRNRFHQDDFLAASISVPDAPEVLAKVVEVLDAVDALRAQGGEMSELVKSLRESAFRLLPEPNTG